MFSRSIFKVDIDMYGASLGMAVFANAPVGFLDAMAIYSTIPKPG